MPAQPYAPAAPALSSRPGATRSPGRPPALIALPPMPVAVARARELAHRDLRAARALIAALTDRAAVH